MFEFLNSLFTQKNKGLGALLDPEDSRDILLSSFQAPVTLPYEYETDISMIPVQDQKSHGSCVGQAGGTVLAYFDYLENKNTDVSRRHIYARCKKEDGVPDAQGTYPRVAASIISKRGATTSKMVPDNNDLPYYDYLAVNETEGILEDSVKRKANYAKAELTLDGLKQAIFQNKLVTITLHVDWKSWKNGKLTRPRKIIGGHRIVLYGWKGDNLKFRNSWGKSWGISGNGTFDFDDYKNYMADALCYTDIPNEILEKAQDQNYVFIKPMKFGDSGFEVKKLQERLAILPADGFYGSYTKKKVAEYQARKGLLADGIAGLRTLAELNRKDTASKLDLWCEAIKEHEGWFIGSRSYRNKNPGNLKHVGQKRAIGKDSGGFCIFATYADGLQELKDLLIRAATPPDNGPYSPNMTLLQFFKKYAPASDNNHPENYAKAVARRIGVVVETPISSLIS